MTPKFSEALYLDSDSESKKNFDNIKQVLDAALTGYRQNEGVVKTPYRRRGMYVFKHLTKFPCVKEPKGGSGRSVYYAIHHMRAFLRDQQNLRLPSHLQNWAQRLGEIQDNDLREEFFRIQAQFATIIREDVMTKGGVFHVNRLPTVKDIETFLMIQGDDRTFVVTPKGYPYVVPNDI